MPKSKLQVKNGAEYWRIVRATAQLVEKWPEWKTGTPVATLAQLVTPANAANGSEITAVNGLPKKKK